MLTPRCSSRERSSQVLPRATRRAHVLAGLIVTPVTDPGRLALTVDHHDVAGVDRGLDVLDSARLGAAPGRRDSGVLRDAVDALDDDLVRHRVGRDDLAFDAAVLAGDDDDLVALLDLHRPTSQKAFARSMKLRACCANLIRSLRSLIAREPRV